MAGFEINGENLFAAFLPKIKPTEKKPDDYITVPVPNGVTEVETGSWKDMMGVNLSTNNAEEPFFSDNDLVLLSKFSTNISPETTENVMASMDGILEAVPYIIEGNIPEPVQEAYVAQHVDGTADRIKNDNGTGLFSKDIDEATGGDQKLFDLAGMMFYVANLT